MGNIQTNTEGKMFLEINENKMVLNFDGRYNNEDIYLIEDAFKKTTKTNSIIFDLKAMKYASSMFLRLCLKAYSKTDRFTIVNTPENIRKMLKTAGVSNRFQIS